jgi:hypothetical protein
MVFRTSLNRPDDHAIWVIRASESDQALGSVGQVPPGRRHASARLGPSADRLRQRGGGSSTGPATLEPGGPEAKPARGPAGRADRRPRKRPGGTGKSRCLHVRRAWPSGGGLNGRPPSYRGRRSPSERLPCEEVRGAPRGTPAGGADGSGWMAVYEPPAGSAGPTTVVTIQYVPVFPPCPGFPSPICPG